MVLTYTYNYTGAKIGDMGDSKGFWNNQTVAGVVTALALPVAAAIAAHFGVTFDDAFQWVSRVWKFWTADVELQRWVFWWWAVATTFLTLFLALRIWFSLTEKPEPPQPKKRPVSLLSFQSYCTDVFFEFRWRWKVTTSGDVWGITMYCPKCDQQLVAADFDITHTSIGSTVANAVIANTRLKQERLTRQTPCPTRSNSPRSVRFAPVNGRRLASSILYLLPEAAAPT